MYQYLDSKTNQPHYCKKCGNKNDLTLGVTKLKCVVLRWTFWIILIALCIAPLSFQLFEIFKTGIDFYDPNLWYSFSFYCFIVAFCLFLKLAQICKEDKFRDCLTCNSCGHSWEVKLPEVMQIKVLEPSLDRSNAR